MVVPKKPAEAASKEQNEYIPAFITKKPFYVPDEGTDAANDYLEHQRLQQEEASDKSRWYDRGKKLGPAATKFRKGACENCGAMTHKTKECLSRPRAKGARWTGKDIQADEVVQKFELGWDAKRDRWNGYDAREYQQVVKDFDELEAFRQAQKAAKGSEEEADGIGDDGKLDEEVRDGDEADIADQPGTTTRNLRLREDTAKYLLNLDLDSAKYDPKTRSMVDAGAQVDQAAALVADDNFMRASGDAAEFEAAQRAAWESQERGDANQMHLQANPTSGEYLRKKEKEEAQARREAQRKLLEERYGTSSSSSADQARRLRDAAVTSNERFTEYDESGGIKGAPKIIPKSKYPEDVLINNHTAVWGSWWRDFQWGYLCCHSLVKNSYCTGEAGREAFEAAENQRTGVSLLPSAGGDGAEERDTTDEVESQPTKVSTTGQSESTAKKRTLAELQHGISEEEMEAYKRSKAKADDPMAKLLGTDELVH